MKNIILVHQIIARYVPSNCQRFVACHAAIGGPRRPGNGCGFLEGGADGKGWRKWLVVNDLFVPVINMDGTSKVLLIELAQHSLACGVMNTSGRWREVEKRFFWPKCLFFIIQLIKRSFYFLRMFKF